MADLKEEERKQKQKLVDQAYLMLNWKKFTDLSKQDTNPDRVLDQFAMIDHDQPAELNNLLFAYKPTYDILLNSTSLQLSYLIPKIRLFKEYRDGDKTKLIEFPFEDYANEEDFTSMLTNRSGRGSGVGIKSLSWTSLGTNNANKYSFSAELELFFQNIEDIFRVRRVDSIGSQQILTKYSDLILQQKKYNKSDNGGPSVYNPDYFKIKAMIGWQVPSTNRPDFITQDFLNEIKASNLSLYMGLASHDIDIAENGNVTIKITYISYIEAVMDNPKSSNVLYAEENSKITAAKESIEKIDGRIESDKQVGAQPNKTLGEERDKKAKELEELEINDKLKVYSRILNELYNSNILKFVKIDPAELESILDFMTKPAEELSSQEQIQQFQKQITDTKNSNEETAAVSQVGRSPIAINESQSLKDQNSLSEAINSSTTEANQKIQTFIDDPNDGKATLVYFYLGDLLQIILKKMFNPDAGNHSFVDKEVKVMLGPVTFYDYGELVDSGFVVKSPGLKSTENPSYSKVYTGKRQSVNIADIPIALSVFTTWFNTNIVDKGLVNMTFKEFIEQIVNDLAIRIMSAETYSFAPRQKTRMVYKALSLPKNEQRFGAQATKYRYQALDFADNSKIFRDVKNESVEDEETESFIFVYGFSENPWDLNSNYEEDLRKGIRHLYYGNENGLIKNIKFKRQDNPLIRSHNIKLASGGAGNDTKLLKEVYNANIEMFGNSIFDVGQTVYIEPSFFGSSKVANRIKFAKDLNIGGYFSIIKMNNSISEGKFNTSLDLRWVARGDGTMNIGDQEAESVEGKDVKGVKIQ